MKRLRIERSETETDGKETEIAMKKETHDVWKIRYILI